MIFGGLQKTTLVDYPGKVAATVFTAGCNFRCPYCHNPELVLPAMIEKQPKITEKEILDFLKERSGFLEGLCITGGEPTIHSDLIDFIQKVKDLGLLVKLDTNGSLPQVLENLLKSKLIDWVAMDIKAPKEKYELFTQGQIKAEIIDQSIKIIKKSKVDYEFRTTLAPEILTEKDILGIVDWIKPADRYYLQQFKNEKTLDDNFLNFHSWPQEQAEALIVKIKPFFSECNLR
ncbi:MAG: anaerobic ribonucleoside-triphosphate reductase activating protein [Candidatus Pacebacteria bacterium]|jgi:pyruvate formate lyase activating enzyme|nr:anaerobic ribonucleoside-triphosphate reductase activating protein [Candidatus Paceibacterota bacterium]MDD5722014.1 anaerobic ribonucleoside-triphosphate reductase activating protein [Candidatus Paceibacterota bacterium]